MFQTMTSKYFGEHGKFQRVQEWGAMHAADGGLVETLIGSGTVMLNSQYPGGGIRIATAATINTGTLLGPGDSDSNVTGMCGPFYDSASFATNRMQYMCQFRGDLVATLLQGVLGFVEDSNVDAYANQVDGAFFRIDGDGLLDAVVTANSVDVAETDVFSGGLLNDIIYTFLIEVETISATTADVRFYVGTKNATRELVHEANGVLIRDYTNNNWKPVAQIETDAGTALTIESFRIAARWGIEINYEIA